MALVLDGDNGIIGVLATNADGDVIIDTNTFFVDAPNNSVGIGTLTPNSKLDVYSTTDSWTRISVRDATSSAFTGVYRQSGTVSAGIFAHNSALNAWEDLWINAHNDGSGGVGGGISKKVIIGGNVGIGTTTPIEPLQVHGSVRLENSGHLDIKMQSGGAGGFSARQNSNDAGVLSMKITEPNGPRGWGWEFGDSTANTQSGHYFRVEYPSGNTWIAGDAKIGTTDGNEKLTVAGAISATSASANFSAGPERVFMDIATGENAVRIGHLQGATSAARDIKFISGNATRMTMYASGKLGINTTPDSGTLQIESLNDNPALLVTNNDLRSSSTAYYSNRNSRNLTSNGSNWAVDGRDPAIVIGSHNDATNKGQGLGLVLHNESQNNDTFSPGIYFSNRSNSGDYNTNYGYIMGRKTGQGVDVNWSIGEIWIDTAGTKHNGNDSYMDDSPAIKVRTTGTVDMRWQPFSFGTLAGDNPANGTGWGFAPLTTQGLNYNNNPSHGYGFTVNEAGYYQCFATGLYDPGGSYVYIGWCINGSQVHHWHSNHTIESNHDFVSSMIRWCNIGDHITLENSSQTVNSQWGGTHSQYYIWKVG